ncbi:MAG: ACT domain-containing protein [Oscillospiraceae bacterium]|nr:ACT domain-containing protein [Oscillospiraceae bacterium]
MSRSNFLLVESSALPPVFSKVIEAKEYLRNAQAGSTAEAARMAGISRSVFYKYKDSVYPYVERSPESIITVQVVLYDRPGVLMAVISQFYSAGANILTINQNIPVKGKAVVSISARVDGMEEPVDALMDQLRHVDGVKTIENIAGE